MLCNIPYNNPCLSKIMYLLLFGYNVFGYNVFGYNVFGYNVFGYNVFGYNVFVETLEYLSFNLIFLVI